MKKIHYILLSLVTLLLTACVSDDYIGTEENGSTISLSSTTGLQTRAGSVTGATAAEKLDNKFFVYGTKLKADETTTETVFPGYEVDYAANTAYTTTSNTADWEYVGKGTDQKIKYWDYGAKSYSFYAYSFGKGDSGSKAVSSDASLYKYKLIGTAAQLKACYISDKITGAPTDFSSHQVQFTFRPLCAQARIGVYETIPGYSIKEITFYSADDTKADKPTLYTASDLPDGGTYTITFNDENKAQLAFSKEGTGAATKTTQAFSAITLNATAEYKETAGNIYMGRSSSAANMSAYESILPNASGASLTMKCDYTLISKDNTGETIKVTGATACVPAAFAQWKSNYQYTYLFKISDNTNGTTGQGTGLYPITLDAVAINDEQQTVTTLTTLNDYYITTYQKNSDVTSGLEYNEGTIYAVIGKGDTSFDTDNATLYEASFTGGSSAYVTESAVESALKEGTYDATAKTYTLNNYTQTVGDESLTNSLVLTDNNNTITAITEIPADATVDGVARTINGCSFSVSVDAGKTSKIYVLAYKMVDGSATAATSTYGGTYYTKNSAGYYVAATISAATKADWENQYKNYYTNPTQPVYAFKVIKVKK